MYALNCFHSFFYRYLKIQKKNTRNNEVAQNRTTITQLQRRIGNKTTTDKEVTQSETTRRCHTMCLMLLPKRYIVAILSFFGFANIYAMRVNLSVAIAVMVANQTVIRDGNEVQEPAEFSWSTEIKGKVL